MFDAREQMEVELTQNVVNVWIMVCDFNCDAYSIIIKRVNRKGLGLINRMSLRLKGYR